MPPKFSANKKMRIMILGNAEIIIASNYDDGLVQKNSHAFGLSTDLSGNQNQTEKIELKLRGRDHLLFRWAPNLG